MSQTGRLTLVVEVGAFFGYVASVLGVSCSHWVGRLCESQWPVLVWWGIQSSSHLKMGKRSLREVTVFKIWEVMLTVVCSGGCKFYQVPLPVIIAVSCQNLDTASCSQSKHAFGTSMEQTGNNIFPLRIQTSADSSGWLLHFGLSVFPLTLLTVKQWERGKWIRERRGIGCLAACCRQKLGKKRSRFLFSLRIIALLFNWLQAGIEVIRNIKHHREAEQKVHGCLCLWAGKEHSEE